MKHLLKNMEIKIKYIQAFTLVELLVTIVVLAITMVIAVPSFYSMIQNNRAVTTTNNLVYAFKLARSEAIKRAVSVSVCPTANSNFTACGTNWTEGWIVFVNPDENGVFDNNDIEPLLRGEDIKNSNYTIRPNPNVSVITFNSSGFTAPGSANVTFTVQAAGCTTNNARTIAISTTGRSSVNAINCT